MSLVHGGDLIRFLAAKGMIRLSVKPEEVLEEFFKLHTKEGLMDKPIWGTTYCLQDVVANMSELEQYYVKKMPLSLLKVWLENHERTISKGFEAGVTYDWDVVASAVNYEIKKPLYVTLHVTNSGKLLNTKEIFFSTPCADIVNHSPIMSSCVVDNVPPFGRVAKLSTTTSLELLIQLPPVCLCCPSCLKPLDDSNLKNTATTLICNFCGYEDDIMDFFDDAPDVACGDGVDEEYSYLADLPDAVSNEYVAVDDNKVSVDDNKVSVDIYWSAQYSTCMKVDAEVFNGSADDIEIAMQEIACEINTEFGSTDDSSHCYVIDSFEYLNYEKV